MTQKINFYITQQHQRLLQVLPFTYSQTINALIVASQGELKVKHIDNARKKASTWSKMYLTKEAQQVVDGYNFSVQNAIIAALNWFIDEQGGWDEVLKRIDTIKEDEINRAVFSAIEGLLGGDHV